MKRLLTILMAGLLIVSFSACEDEIELELDKAVDKLVVEGFITNLDEAQIIRLSRNISYTTDSLPLAEAGATVIVRDDLQREYIFTEIEDGMYANVELQGDTGRSYNLYIQTQDGVEYVSDPASLKPVPPIDTAYYEYQPAFGPFAEEGYEIFIDTKDPETFGDFYRWKLYYNQVLLNEPFNLYLGDDRFVNGNEVDSIDFRGVRFQIGDTATVEQCSLTKEAYKFYQTLFLQTGPVGGPFDSPPAPIVGNIYKKEDPSDYALGYFGASAVSRKTVIIKEGTQ